MAERKISLMDGIGGIASQTSFLGGMVAGTSAPARAFQPPEQEQDQDEVVWDDCEEQRYRDWLKEVAAQRQNDVNWNEYEREEEYRERLREQAQARADQDIPINWDDQKEREYRRKYIEMRRQQAPEANWNEYKAEEDHREAMRRKQDGRKKNKVVWDDEDERKCQQRYRKNKYK